MPLMRRFPAEMCAQKGTLSIMVGGDKELWMLAWMF